MIDKSEGVAVFSLKEHLGHDWEAYPVSFPLPTGMSLAAGSPVQVRDLTYNCTLAGQVDAAGKVHFVTDLWSDEERRYSISPAARKLPASLVVKKQPDAYILDTGRLIVAVPRFTGKGVTLVAPPPVLWLKGSQGIQRGKSAWTPGVTVVAAKSRLLARGPVFAEVELKYTFENRGVYFVRIRVYSNAPVVLVHEEKSSDMAGAWTFSLYDGFAPDRAQLGIADAQGWPVDYSADGHLCRHIFFNHFSQYQDFKELSCLYRSDGNREADALGIFPLEGDTWENVVSNWISLDTTVHNPDIRYTFNLAAGRRAFALFALSQKETRIRRHSDYTYGKWAIGNAGTGVYALRAKWDLARLDSIKDMTLAWEHSVATAKPLYATPERLADLKTRLAAHPELYGKRFEADVLLAGNPIAIAKMKQEFFWHLERMCDDALELGPNACNVNPVMFRPLGDFPYYYEVLSLRGVLTPAEDAKARAIMVYFTYFTASDNYYFGRRSLLPDDHPDQVMSLYKGMRSENFGTDRFVAVGQMGALFPEHPAAAQWRAMSRELFDLQMQQLVGKCGNWCEGVNYVIWAVQLLINYALAVRDADEDWFEDPRFKRLFRFMIDTLSPHHPLHDGMRTGPGYGSYGDNGSVCGYSHFFVLMATIYRQSDPQFSAELMWAHREMGGKPFQFEHAPDRAVEEGILALFTDFNLPAVVPTLVSQGLPDFGAVFRHQLPDARETFLIARASRFWPHGHTDSGSFFMYWRNAPLITEAGRGLNEATALLDTNGKVHNIIRFDGRDPLQYVWPLRHGLESFVAKDDLEYAVLDCRVEKLCIPGRRARGHGDLDAETVNIRYFRHILFLKPDIFVLYDVFSPSAYRAEFRLHCLAESVVFEGNMAMFQGRHGVDLQVTAVTLEPPVFSTVRVLDTCSVEFSQPPGAPILTVLTPFEQGSKPEVECGFNDGVLTVRRQGETRQVRFLKTATPELYAFENQ